MTKLTAHNDQPEAQETFYAAPLISSDKTSLEAAPEIASLGMHENSSNVNLIKLNHVREKLSTLYTQRDRLQQVHKSILNCLSYLYCNF